MTATQTLEIPASRRLVIDVPPEIPAGWSAVLTFAPSEAESGPARDGADEDADEEDAPFLKLMGCRKGIPGFSVEDFLARCREDKEYELALEKRRQEERARYAKKLPS